MRASRLPPSRVFGAASRDKLVGRALAAALQGVEDSEPDFPASYPDIQACRRCRRRNVPVSPKDNIIGVDFSRDISSGDQAHGRPANGAGDMATRPPIVAIVEDDPSVRKSLKRLLAPVA